MFGKYVKLIDICYAAESTAGSRPSRPARRKATGRMTGWTATYVQMRDAGHIVAKAVTIAVGVNSDGRREVLGMDIGCSEAETVWVEFLRTLTRGGIHGVKLVISDAHEGLKAAITRVLNAAWQRYRGAYPHAQLAAAFVATAFAQEDAAAASGEVVDPRVQRHQDLGSPEWCPGLPDRALQRLGRCQGRRIGRSAFKCGADGRGIGRPASYLVVYPVAARQIRVVQPSI